MAGVDWVAEDGTWCHLGIMNWVPVWWDKEIIGVRERVGWLGEVREDGSVHPLLRPKEKRKGLVRVRFDPTVTVKTILPINDWHSEWEDYSDSSFSD
jgi:hypothetical protein